jgi:hypothetical protein
LLFNQKDAATKAAISAQIKERTFDVEYYHNWWLTFLYLGLPAPHMVTDAPVCESLKSGAATRQMIHQEAMAQQGKAVKGNLKAGGGNGNSNFHLKVNMPRQKSDSQRQRKVLTDQMKIANKLQLRNQITSYQLNICEMDMKIHDAT